MSDRLSDELLKLLELLFATIDNLLSGVREASNSSQPFGGQIEVMSGPSIQWKTSLYTHSFIYKGIKLGGEV